MHNISKCYSFRHASKESFTSSDIWDRDSRQLFIAFPSIGKTFSNKSVNVRDSLFHNFNRFFTFLKLPNLHMYICMDWDLGLSQQILYLGEICTYFEHMSLM
jgi:hypothetical protein